jgi:hypothetical protein
MQRAFFLKFLGVSRSPSIKALAGVTPVPAVLAGASGSTAGVLSNYTTSALYDTSVLPKLQAIAAQLAVATQPGSYSLNITLDSALLNASLPCAQAALNALIQVCIGCGVLCTCTPFAGSSSSVLLPRSVGPLYVVSRYQY